MSLFSKIPAKLGLREAQDDDHPAASKPTTPSSTAVDPLTLLAIEHSHEARVERAKELGAPE